MLHDLQPVIRVSNLQDRATFDSVLQRSRRSLRDAAAQDGPHDAALQAAVHAALQALDRNVVLRRQSSFTQNALFQG
ncbi:hypothetical protein AKI39_19375 [Bordetella sp. H567]|nr:hypothetical protein AKI39_19375 [Bordetella sp. H567]